MSLKSEDSPNPLKVAPASSKEITEAVSRTIGELYPRIQALNDYSAHLLTSDEKVNGLVDNVVAQAHWTYRTTVWLYVLTYILTIATFVVSFVLFFSNRDLPAIVCVASAVVILILLLNRTPQKNIRYLLDNLIKLNVLYLGYTRQIHQIDATFKDILLNRESLDKAQLEEMLGHIQAIVDETMSSISQVLDEFQD